MSDVTMSLVIQLVITAGGIITAVIAMRQQERRNSQDRAAQIDERFASFVAIQDADRDRLRAEVEGLRAEIETLRRRLRVYERGVDKLIRQLQEAGQTPAWFPPNGNDKPEAS